MNLTYDETMIMAIYNTGSRERLITDLTAMREYLEPDEEDLRELTDAVIGKLNAMTDAEFATLDLVPDFDDHARSGSMDGIPRNRFPDVQVFLYGSGSHLCPASAGDCLRGIRSVESADGTFCAARVERDSPS